MAKRKTRQDVDHLMPQPSWEIVNLLARYIDGKSLATASCVSKSWNLAMSSDFVWKRVYAADFPCHSASLCVVGVDDPLVSFRRLYRTSYTSTKKGRKLVPTKPELSLNDMVFIISVVFKRVTIEVVKRGDDIVHDPNGMFMFDIGLDGRGLAPFELEDDEDVKVTWDVVLKGWESMFRMMGTEGKAKSSFGSEGYLSEELPSDGGFSGDASTGIVADLKLKYSGTSGKEVIVDKLVIGMMNKQALRYSTVDDGLRYLQKFLRP